MRKLLAACSSNPTTAPAGSAASGAPAPATSSAGAAPAGSAAADATAIVAKLKAAGLPVTGVITFTAATDPNHQLGRPGGYTSKATWADTQIDASQAQDRTPGNVDLGGSVEVFASTGDAQSRVTYIQAVLKASPMLAKEYDYAVGDAVVRVSGLLTPGQAAAYQAAAGG